MRKERSLLTWIVGLLAVALIVAAMVFFTPLGMLVFIPLQMHQIRNVESRMQEPQIAGEVATNLALYCQSMDLLQITNGLGASQLPPPIPKLGTHPWGNIGTNYAQVEFGGGFYHYGYSLSLNESGSNIATNVWELSITREGQPNKLLQTITLPVSARVPVSLFLSNSLAEYNSRLAKTPRDLRLHQSKIAFLLQYDRSQVRSACTNAVNDLPHHWWPQLTLALWDAGHGHLEDASRNFATFADSKSNYSTYLYLAYFYHLTGKTNEAANAVEKAVSLPVKESWDDSLNSECLSYSLAVYLYQDGKYATVVKLCDAVLPLAQKENYAAPSLSVLKAAAQSALSGGNPDFRPNEDLLAFHPYEDSAIRALLSP